MTAPSEVSEKRKQEMREEIDDIFGGTPPPELRGGELAGAQEEEVVEAEEGPVEPTHPSFFDVVIEDDLLEDALATIANTADAVRQNTKARQLRKQLLLGHELKDGDRVRCGAYTFRMSSRQGGGFRIEPWSALSSTTPRLIED